MGLSRTISEIKTAISVENRKFSHTLCILHPAEGVPLELGTGTRGQKKLERWGYRAEKEV